MMSRKYFPKRTQGYEVRKRLCCVTKVGKKSIEEASIQDRERERERDLLGSFMVRNHVSTRSQRKHQLSPKCYLNLHSLGVPQPPSVEWSHNAMGGPRLYPVGLEKNAKKRVRERGQEGKSGASSYSWEKPAVYLEFQGFGTKNDLGSPLPEVS